MEFYIEKISASGAEVTTSYVEFTSGLNIICGASDTGKSAIAACIKFLMGGAKPFGKKKNGFTDISMTIRTLKGPIIFERKIGKNVIHVTTDVPGIEARDYDVKYDDTNGNKRPVIHEVWRYLLGIKNDPRIILRKEGDRNHLTMTGILRAFYLNEDDIDSPQSILLPMRTPSNIVYFLSALLYLIIGNEFADQNARDTDTISKAKRDALSDFAHERISEWSEKRINLERKLSEFEGIDVEKELEKSLQELENAENALSNALSRQKEIIKELSSYETQATELSLVLSRYKSLETQYASDIKRLSFIVEGEKLLSGIEASDECPFCGGTLNKHKKISYIESSRAEMGRIISQLEGLKESELSVNEELSEVEQNLAVLEEERKKISDLISNTLSPATSKLSKRVTQFQTYIETKKEFDLLQVFSNEIQKSLEEKIAPKPVDPTADFKPREHYPSNFVSAMSDFAYTILEECKYRGLNTSEFDLSIFDLRINGDTKKESHGKGYNSFINSVCGLALRQYLNSHAEHNPGFFIIDTPLHGFDEGVTDTDQESMKYGLFNYFVKHANEGQTIVIENIRNLPSIDFEKAGVNIIEFTHNNYEPIFKNNRYGFLIGIEK